MMKKLLTFAIAISIIVLAIPFPLSVSASGMEDSGIDYTESIGMLNNPYMGYPNMSYLLLSEEGQPVQNDSGFTWYYINLNQFSGGNELYSPAEDKKEPFGSVDKPISDAALESFSKTLQNLRNNGGTALLRFVYDWKGTLGCEPSDFNMILTHIKQLCEVVSQYDDIVLGFECGIIGVFGEMHSSIYTDKEYVNAVIDTYLDNTPDSMILMLRSQVHMYNYFGIDKATLLNTVTEKGDKKYRLGYYNDGYMNSINDLGTWSCENLEQRANEIRFLKSQSEHTTYGGEYGSAYSILPNDACQPQNAIPEMYQTHVNFMRGNVYKYGDVYKDDDGGYSTSTYGYDQFTYGPQYEKSWYPDNSAFYGQDCHQFITSHLGYRLVLRESKLSPSTQGGGILELSGTIENTGFANVLHNPTAQILLVKDGAIYTCDVNLDAFDIKSCKKYDYNFTLSLPSSLAAGDYQVYLRLLNSNDDSLYSIAGSGIEFANSGGTYDPIRKTNIGGIYNQELGANRLGTVTVTAAAQTESAACDVFAQIDSTKAGAKATIGAPQLLGYGFENTGEISLSYNQGDNVSLSSLDYLHSGSTSTYTWYKNGTVISNEKELNISGVTSADAGVYKLTIASDGNSYTTISVNINVTEHNFSNWVTTVVPTCSSTGEAKRTCSDCSITETKILPALSHILENPVTIPSTCMVRGKIAKPCKLCDEIISYKLLDLVSHTYEYTITGDTVSAVCKVCGDVFGPKEYNSSLKGDTISAVPINYKNNPIIMVGAGGFAPNYVTKEDTNAITFLFKMTGVDSPITLGKFRTLSYTVDNPGLIVDSNNGAPNYWGECAYEVSEDGIWAFSISKVVMNGTGNNGFGGINWAAFSDPESTKGTADPLNLNDNSTFQLLGIYDSTLSYDVIYVDADGNFLEKHTGSYNKDILWSNLISQVDDINKLYKGEQPTKPSDSDYTYTFDKWVDKNGNTIEAAVGDIIAYPSFKATQKGNTTAIAETKEALTWDSIRNTNTSQNIVTDNLVTLPTAGASDTQISWDSSNPAVSAKGIVTRPTYASGNVSLTLTATISKGSESDTVVFHLTILALPNTGEGISDPIQFKNEPLVMVGPEGFVPSYEAGNNTWSITFLFRMTGVESPITLGKFRALTYVSDRPDLIVDSNGLLAPNYYGECAYKVTEDGVWAFSISKEVMNFTGNDGFGGINWAAFSDPLSTKGTADPINENENSTFELLGIYDGTLSYDITYVDANGEFLEKHTGSYNEDIKWSNLISKVDDINMLYKGELPTKPSDSYYTYSFDKWVDKNGNPLETAVGDIIAYPSFKAVSQGDAAAVADDKAVLTWDSIRYTNTFQNSIMDNLVTLPMAGTSGTQISWDSSNPAVSDPGIVTRPPHSSGNISVTLLRKYNKFYPEMRVEKTFNDILGFRMVSDNYEEILNQSVLENLELSI